MSDYTHTVWCNTDKELTQNFTNQRQAVAYANKLLKQGHRAVLRPYRQRRSYIDFLIESETTKPHQ